MVTDLNEELLHQNANAHRSHIKHHDPFQDFFLETSYIARVYGHSLRDNFVGYRPVQGKEQEALALEGEYIAEINKSKPDFASLLRIEAAFTTLLPDESIRSRYWAVDDRFQRVVPLTTRVNYQASIPPRGDGKWEDAEFLRTQTRTLLDIIYANYVLNIGREKSVKRLKVIMFFVFVISTGSTLLITCLSNGNKPMTLGITLLIYFGMLGSMLSISQRLQTAVSRDAMSEDSIFELTGLRVGWVGILMSIFMGGAFAVMFYFIVVSGVLRVAYPTGINDTPDSVSFSNSSSFSISSSSSSSSSSALAQPASGNSLATPPILTPDVAPVPLSTPENEKASKEKEDAAEHAGKDFVRKMQFHTLQDWYKMLLLAFLAGFAERLVPDILNRLSKRST